MLKTIIASLALGLCLADPALAQVTPAVKETTDKPASPRRDPPQPVNIKLELTILDQTGAQQSVKRQVSMIVADQQNGGVRSNGRLNVEGRGWHDVVLNVDAYPTILENNKVRLNLTIEYAPKPGADSATSGEGIARLTERLGLIIEAGKPLVISQASDPTTDRKITAELLATILR